MGCGLSRQEWGPRAPLWPGLRVPCPSLGCQDPLLLRVLQVASSPRHLAWPPQGPLPSLAGHPAPRCSLVALRDREHCFPGQILGRSSAPPVSGASHQRPAQPAGPQWPRGSGTLSGLHAVLGCSGHMCSESGRGLGLLCQWGRAGGESSVPSTSWGKAGSPTPWGRDMGVSQGRAQQAGTSNSPLPTFTERKVCSQLCTSQVGPERGIWQEVEAMEPWKPRVSQ